MNCTSSFFDLNGISFFLSEDASYTEWKEIEKNNLSVRPKRKIYFYLSAVREGEKVKGRRTRERTLGEEWKKKTVGEGLEGVGVSWRERDVPRVKIGLLIFSSLILNHKLQIHYFQLMLDVLHFPEISIKTKKVRTSKVRLGWEEDKLEEEKVRYNRSQNSGVGEKRWKGRRKEN